MERISKANTLDNQSVKVHHIEQYKILQKLDLEIS